MDSSDEKIPSYYKPVSLSEVNQELGSGATIPKDQNQDSLPFDALDGRRFEIWTYLITQGELESTNAIVTLVKSSGDGGRDVLVHHDGALQRVIQCKNHRNKLSRAALIHEILKLALHDQIEHFLPEKLVTYEIWAPGGLSDEAEVLVQSWPNSISGNDIETSFSRLTAEYKSLRDLKWEKVKNCLHEELRSRLILKRHEGFSLSNKSRSNSQVHSRFFESSIVMRKEDVDKFLKGAIESAMASLSQSGSASAMEIRKTTSERVEGNAIDSEINDARDMINAREFQDGAIVLKRLIKSKSEQLNNHQRFRITTNQGAAALGLELFEEAARLFLEAVTYEPNDQLAQANEVVAYYLLGDRERAYELARERLKQYPSNARIASLWINCASESTQIQDLTQSLPSSLLKEQDVCVALARRCMVKLDLDEAESYASNAASYGKQWSIPYLLLAQIAVARLVQDDIGVKPLLGDRQSVIEAGLSHAKEAVRLSKCEGPQSQAEAHLVHAELQLAIGSRSEAHKSVKAANMLDPSNLGALVTIAQIEILESNVDAALAALADAYKIETRPDVSLLYAQALATRAKGGDLKQAATIAQNINLELTPQIMRPAVAIFSVQSMGRLKEWQRASEYARQVSTSLDQATSYSLQAYISYGSDSPDEAGELARTAVKEIREETHANTKEFLARMLMRLGRPEDALPLYQNLFDRRIPAFNPMLLIECAARLKRDSKVLDDFEELHKLRSLEWAEFEFELSYLERYDPFKAIRRVEEFLGQFPDHKLAMLHLSLVGLLLDKRELMRTALADLPTVQELPINYIGPALNLLMHGKDRGEAVDYAYRFLREHGDSQEAHEAFIQAVIMRPDRDEQIELEVVAPDTAVMCEELPGGELRWFVLEDTENPVWAFEEISRSDPKRSEFLGKRIGDTVVLAASPIADRRGVIKRILHKHVRRFQDCIGELQMRFGPTASVQSVRIGSASCISQDGFTALLSDLRERAKRVETVQSLYTEQPMSLHMYGVLFGKNAYEALTHIAATDGLTLKCSTGIQQETADAIVALRNRCKIIVDISAVATIRLLELESVFKSQKHQFQMTQATWIELQDTLGTLHPDRDPSGVMAYRDGSYFWQEYDPKLLDQKKLSERALLAIVRGNFEILSGADLATVEPDTREMLTKGFGQYGAEAILAGRSTETILWTDDLGQAQLASSMYQVRRVWTQAVLMSLRNDGELGWPEFRRATAKLVGMKFTSTQFDGNCMLEAARLAEWQTGSFPLKQLIDVFSDSPAPGLLGQLLAFFVLSHEEPILPTAKSIVTQAFLNALWRNPAGNQYLLRLRTQISTIFGLNVIVAAEFQDCYDAWRRSLIKPII